MWMGTAHFTQGCPHVQHVAEVQACFAALPPTALPVFLAADSNASVGWNVAADGVQQAFSKDGKGVAMLDVMGSRDLQVVGVREEHLGLPTSRPRKHGVQGKVIDVIATARTSTGTVWIEKNSCHTIGTDHELIMCAGYLPRSQTIRRRFDCRPRVVVGDIPEQRAYNQQVLRDMAVTYTRVAQGQAYKDPDDVKAAFRRARVQQTALAWKQAQQMRRKARAEWEGRRLDGASQGNWQDFRAMRKKGGGWETHFAEMMEGEAHERIHRRLQDIYEGDTLPPFPEGLIQDSPLFMLPELKDAVGRGRCKKAVGTDMVPRELLMAICEKDDEASKLLDWMNNILATGDIPKDWGEVVMIALAKISRPELVKQVRPISMGSAVSKLFARLLLEKSMLQLGQPTSRQCAGRGRQSTDYVFSMTRMMSLEREWKWGLKWIKIDLRKAFDKVSRVRLMKMIQQRLGLTWLSRAWYQLLQPTQAFLQTLWGSTDISMTSGIKQGAVESPCLFSLLSDVCFEEASRRFQWDLAIPPIPGLALKGILYMDDSVMWDVQGSTLALRVEQLAGVLKEWGLEINYKSPFCKETGGINIAGVAIEPDTHLDIMGLQLTVQGTASETLAALLGRARDKFWSIKHILCRPTNIKKRLKVLHSVIGGSVLWCGGGMVPDVQALGLINSFQYQLIAWMLRRGRRSDETWLGHRLRTLREARHVLHSAQMGRRSSDWLSRVWRYAGHRSRCSQRPVPGAAAILDEFRTLEWWEVEQRRARGLRHSGRFFAKLLGHERNLNVAAGGPWRTQAANRAQWKGKEKIFITNMDIPWASGRQFALPF